MTSDTTMMTDKTATTTHDVEETGTMQTHTWLNFFVDNQLQSDLSNPQFAFAFAFGHLAQTLLSKATYMCATCNARTFYILHNPGNPEKVTQNFFFFK